MLSDYLLGLSSKGFHRIHYTDWGDPGAERVVICVHGLSRNCRDFDDLARTRLVEFTGVGHAPALMAEDQIRAIRDFLLVN